MAQVAMLQEVLEGLVAAVVVTGLAPLVLEIPQQLLQAKEIMVDKEILLVRTVIQRVVVVVLAQLVKQANQQQAALAETGQHHLYLVLQQLTLVAAVAAHIPVAVAADRVEPAAVVVAVAQVAVLQAEL